MSFCDICPEGDKGYWALGYSAWERCWAAGHCMLGTWPGEARARRAVAATEPGPAPAPGGDPT